MYFSAAMAALGYVSAVLNFIFSGVISGVLSIVAAAVFTAGALAIYLGATHLKIYGALIITAVFSLIVCALYFGSDDGFTPLWFMLLPSAAYFYMGIKRGSIVSAAVLVITGALLFIPLFNKDFCFEFSLTYKLKFCLSFIAVCISALFIELLKNSIECDYNGRALQLEYMAKHDILTGVKNRTAFNQIFTEECENARSSLGKLSLIISDLDEFKKINDTYGHLTGDRVLRKTAEIFRRESPNPEHIFRWGGEEFAVILQDSDLECAVRVAENIRFALEQMNIELAENEFVGITASFGVTQVDLDNKYSESIKNADDALYEAKKAGRNTVKIFVA